MPPYIVKETARRKPIIIARFGSIPPRRMKIVPVAKVARDTRTVSQPTKTKYESRLGTIFPLILFSYFLIHIKRYRPLGV
jgi:hypothetical protein